jgi:putative Mn2+ efflux pump MntP
MFGVLLVAVALGASNFAAAIGIGMGGLDGRTRRRVAWVFGLCETAMPLLGLAIGHRAAGDLGSVTHDLGSALLIAIGLVTTVRGLRATTAGQPRADHLGRLIVAGLALSVDTLVVGFALASVDVPFAVAAAVIGVVSASMSLVGLELGNRLGARTGQRGEVLGGVVLVGVGIALATGYLG